MYILSIPPGHKGGRGADPALRHLVGTWPWKVMSV